MFIGVCGMISVLQVFLPCSLSLLQILNGSVVMMFDSRDTSVKYYIYISSSCSVDLRSYTFLVSISHDALEMVKLMY